jgi:hypothetical protein
MTFAPPHLTCKQLILVDREDSDRRLWRPISGSSARLDGSHGDHPSPPL